MFLAVLKQRYPGHAVQAGHRRMCHAHLGRFVIVVDEDVNVTDLEEVIWAVARDAIQFPISILSRTFGHQH